MIKSSIFYSITVIFLSALAGVILAFTFFIKYDQTKYTEELNNKYSVIAGATLFYLNGLIKKEEIDEQLKGYETEEITASEQKRYIIEEGEILGTIKNRIGESSIIYFDGSNYLNIVSRDSDILLRDIEFEPFRYIFMKITFGVVLGIVLFVYILIIKKIQPLRRLKQQIIEFDSGNFEIPKKLNATDEISEVTNAFYDYVEHINRLNNSRQLFLRNIMHELKTPITKGRITAEMIEDKKHKHRLISVFERLDNTINEFAYIEKLTSGIKDINLNLSVYRLIDIFDEAVDLAMSEKQSVNTSIEKNLNLYVDFKLFSVAVKNMIDNAIKYSPDKAVEIMADEQKIEFISRGEQLKEPLEHYFKPFTLGNNNDNKSLGLGLYIVFNIVKAHGMNLSYRYKDGKNIFAFEDIKAF